MTTSDGIGLSLTDGPISMKNGARASLSTKSLGWHKIVAALTVLGAATDDEIIAWCQANGYNKKEGHIRTCRVEITERKIPALAKDSGRLKLNPVSMVECILWTLTTEAEREADRLRYTDPRVELLRRKEAKLEIRLAATRVAITKALERRAAFRIAA